MKIMNWFKSKEEIVILKKLENFTNLKCLSSDKYSNIAIFRNYL